MPQFSQTSLANLNTCDRRIRTIAHLAISFFDFSVVDGYRNKERQNEYFANKVSKVQWPDSNHNHYPSRAMDCYPWNPKYGSLTEADEVVNRILQMNGMHQTESPKVLSFIREEYCRMAQTILIAAKEKRISIRWGGDWDSDSDRFDQTFHDLAHFELVD